MHPHPMFSCVKKYFRRPFCAHLPKLNLVLTTLVFFCLTSGITKAESDPPEKKISSRTTPTLANVHYGPDQNQVLDFWKATSEHPTPMIVNIHGGGWIHGSKGPLGADSEYLSNGISIIHISYRLTPEHPLPAPVADAARALEFVCHKAKDWNIDPKRIVLIGDSAGGCTALWLATHDASTKADASNPAEQESARILGVLAFRPQTTIDPSEVRDFVGLKAVYHPMFRCAGGFTNNQEMFQAIANNPKIARLYREFSPINCLSSDDPPMLLVYGAQAPPQKGDVHDAAFGVLFKKRADALGLHDCYLKIQGDKEYTGFPGGEAEFICKVLQIKRP